MALETSDFFEPIADLVATEVAGYSLGALVVSGVVVGAAAYGVYWAARKATQNVFG